jgi:Ohr subfamily peroxiredoxin
MHVLKRVPYKTRARSTGGRDGESRILDGSFSVSLSTPEELGGAGGDGTNPEQLFASGYSACFIGALKFVAGREKIELPEDHYVEAEIGIGPIRGGFAIQAQLDICLPGIEKEKAQELVEKAHQACPYSNATRGNIEVTLNVVE